MPASYVVVACIRVPGKHQVVAAVRTLPKHMVCTTYLLQVRVEAFFVLVRINVAAVLDATRQLYIETFMGLIRLSIGESVGVGCFTL